MEFRRDLIGNNQKQKTAPQFFKTAVLFRAQKKGLRVGGVLKMS